MGEVAGSPLPLGHGRGWLARFVRFFGTKRDRLVRVLTATNRMNIRVRFFGNYRRLVDSPQTFLNLREGATPIDVVGSLAEIYGENLRSALVTDRDGMVRLRPGIRIALGDEIIDCGSELTSPLQGMLPGRAPQIEVFIFPSLTGG